MRSCLTTFTFGTTLVLMVSCLPPKNDPHAPGSLRSTLSNLEAEVGSSPSRAEQDRAMARLDEILEHDPVSYRARARKIRWLASWGRHREALNEIRKLERGYAPEPWSEGIKAQALYETGHKDEAAAAFREVLATNRSDSGALRGLGILLAEAGHDEAAETYLARAVQVRPNDAGAMEALKLVRFLKSPDWKEKLETVSENPARKRLARMLLGRGEIARGTAVLIEAYRGAPDDPDVLMGLAFGFANRGRTARALSFLDAAARRASRDPDVWYNLGVACRRIGRHHAGFQARAVRSFEAALGIVPDDPQFLLAAANARAETGDLEGAIERYEQALRDDPGHPGVLSDYGRALVRAGDGAGGMRLFRRGLKANPDHPGLLVNLMVASFENHLPEQAWALHARIAALPSPGPEIRRILARYSRKESS